jgi:transposase
MGVTQKLPRERKTHGHQLVFHAFGLVGYRYVNQSFKGGQVTFRIEQPRERHRCSACGSAEVWNQGGSERTFHAVPIGSKPVKPQLKVPRVLCFNCGKVRPVKFGCADPNKHYTRAFERYVLDLSRYMTIQDVAKHLQVGWDVVKDIQARALQQRFGKPNLHKLKKIAIDEIAISKGHRYLTVVLDLVRGAVVFVGDGKGVDSLKPLWLRRARAKIVAVATARSQPYIRAVRDNLPRCRGRCTCSITSTSSSRSTRNSARSAVSCTGT